jgi:hypothetical protein
LILDQWGADMFGLLDYRDRPHCRLHSPRTERMTEKSAVTPSAMIVQMIGLLTLKSPAPTLPKPAKRRGRKSMNPSERQRVSERMRKYWAGRRQPKPEAKGRKGDPLVTRIDPGESI